MISRSESLPITIETRGLLIRSPWLFLQRPPRDVLAVMRAIKLNLAGSLIRASNCGREVFGAGGYSEHSSACGVVIAIARAGAGVENLDVFEFVRIFNSGNFFSDFDCPRITAGSHHHAYR